MSSSASVISQVQSAFQALNLPLGPTVNHEAVETVDKHKLVKNLPKGVLAKNLFLKSKKKAYYLVTVRADSAVQLNELAKSLGEANGSLRFAEEKQLQEVLGVTKGCVTPLAVLNDKQKQVTVVIDKALTTADAVLVHPLSNAATVAVPPDSLLKFIAAHAASAAKVLALSDATESKEPAAAAAAAQKPQATPAPKSANTEKKPAAAPAPQAKAAKKKEGGALGIDVSKSENISDWYAQVVTKSEMIEYYDISGCYILRPWAFAIWETIQRYFDDAIKRSGVKNAYFPLFISSSALNKEKDHVEGFAPEVAWVTKAGNSELEEPIAVRPTSETIMYPAYAKWIRSHRDLPLRLNQWTNVVRWEFKYPTPFIRSREFLWQEGHSAFATREEADREVLEILDLYASVYQDLLAVPVTKGKKTESEKFAGGDYTTTVEAYIPATGRGIQAATSHCLGQNFSKMFQIEFEDQNKQKQYAWQNSWGLTTRTIGVMIMQHSDDKGLVLPPAVAPIQIVIVPITFSKSSAETNKHANILLQKLRDLGLRVELDDRPNYNPGWKYNHWELKGVPFRFELGPQEIKEEKVSAVRRDNNESFTVKWNEFDKVPDLLRKMQADMLARAQADVQTCTKQVTKWDDFLAALDERCRALVPWCGVAACEKSIKERTGVAAKQAAAEARANAADGDDPAKKLTAAAKSLCIPFHQPAMPANTLCVGCQAKAVNWTMFGRSY